MHAGIVLFPEDTLPLRVLQPRFKAAVDRAMRNDEALNTIGVIHVRARDGHVHIASIGTTAEVSAQVIVSCNNHPSMTTSVTELNITGFTWPRHY